MVVKPYSAYQLSVEFEPNEAAKEQDFTAYLEDFEVRVSSLGSPRLAEMFDFLTVFFASPVTPSYVTSNQAAALLSHASSIKLGKDKMKRKTAQLEFEGVPEINVKLTQLPQPLLGKRELHSTLRRIVGHAYPAIAR